MLYEHEVLVGMMLVAAAASFFAVMFGGRKISYRALGSSEFRESLTEAFLGWSGLLWFCGLPMTIAGPVFLTVPMFMPYMNDIEPAVRITLLIHLLGVPGLIGMASLAAGPGIQSEQ